MSSQKSVRLPDDQWAELDEYRAEREEASADADQPQRGDRVRD